MKTTRKFAAVSSIAFSAFAFAALVGFAAQAGPITPSSRNCTLYTLGGADCSFTSSAQCEAALDEAAVCYGNTNSDDRLPVRESGGTIY